MATKTANSQRDRKATVPGRLEDLVRILPPIAIRDDVQHENAVAMIDRLMQVADLTDGQAAYLETLLQLVEFYEARHHAIALSGLGGTRMLKHLLEQSGMTGGDLARLLDVHATLGSKILGGQRRLTWDHAKTLAARFKVAPALFMD